LVRLLIAFALGLPTTLIFPFSILSTPSWWRPEIPLAVLLVAMLLSIVRDPQVRAHKVPGVRLAVSVGVAVLVSGTIEVFAALGAYQPPSQTPATSAVSGALAYVGLVLVPLVVGLAAAFTVGSGGTWRLALGIALASWLGRSSST
jgi:hypothetical protein